MASQLKIDHIVIMVDDLAAAMSDYAALGLTVLEGGVHIAGRQFSKLSTISS